MDSVAPPWTLYFGSCDHVRILTSYCNWCWQQHLHCDHVSNRKSRIQSYNHPRVGAKIPHRWSKPVSTPNTKTSPIMSSAGSQNLTQNSTWTKWIEGIHFRSTTRLWLFFTQCVKADWWRQAVTAGISPHLNVSDICGQLKYVLFYWMPVGCRAHQWLLLAD